METVKLIIQILAAFIGILAALTSILFFVRLRWPSPAFWFLKMYASALSPFVAATGLLVAIAGLTTGSLFVSLIGVIDVLIFSTHFIMVTRAPHFSNSFEKAFGLQWEKRIGPEQKKYFLPSRTALRLPATPAARLQQNISFATIPGTDRKLLCDIWQPATNVASSGVAFIYLHGSAFYFLDKDLNTRPFFRQLAAQGHVVMDIAYRLFPETGIMGMVNDAKRAIVWMKENAKAYNIDPGRIVIGGGSAGAQLALLAAYTSNDPQFTPEELEGRDINACGVISLYGSNDLEALYYHTNQHLTTRSVPGQRKKPVPTKMPAWIVKKMGTEYYRLGFNKGLENTGTLAPLLGGHPDECPQTYALFSVATHVHSGCPPTLLVHGDHDIMAPVRTTGVLCTKLLEKKVPTVMHILPQTEHGFDLVLPNISPSAHNAIYDVERFLALMAVLPASDDYKKIEGKAEVSHELAASMS